MNNFLWNDIKEILKVRNRTICFCILFCIFSCYVPFLSSSFAADLTPAIRFASQRFQIDEDLIRQVIRAESNERIRAVSPRDARGLMQITRQTWDWICGEFLGTDWSFDEYAFDAEKNILVGTRFLRWISDYLARHHASLQAEWLDLVLACYNAGPGAVRRYGFTVPPYQETRRYIERIRLASGLPPAGFMAGLPVSPHTNLQ